MDIKTLLTNIVNKLGKTEYSTEEKIIGKWIDGKPLYRKTYEGNLNGVDISSLHIKRLINAYGSVNSNYGQQWVFPTGGGAEYGYSVAVFVYPIDNPTSLSVYKNGYYSGSAYGVLVIEYTKTTD